MSSSSWQVRVVLMVGGMLALSGSVAMASEPFVPPPHTAAMAAVEPFVPPPHIAAMAATEPFVPPPHTALVG